MEASRGVIENSSPPPVTKPAAVSSTQQNQGIEQSAHLIQPEKKSAKFKLSVLMLSLVIFVVAMDSVIVAAALPAIAASLNGSSLEAFWVGTSYLLAQTVRIPLILSFISMLFEEVMLKMAC